MTNSGSPITIFTTKDLKDIFRTNVLFAGQLPQSNKYVDFNTQPLKIPGFIHVNLELGKQEIQSARLMVAAAERSLMGRNWLAALH